MDKILLKIIIEEPPGNDGIVVYHDIKLVEYNNGDKKVHYNDRLITDLIRQDVDNHNTNILIYILENLGKNYTTFESEEHLEYFLYMYEYIYNNIGYENMEESEVFPPSYYEIMHNEAQDNFDPSELAGAAGSVTNENLGYEQEQHEAEVESIQEYGEMGPPVEPGDVMFLPMGGESIQESGEMGPPVEPKDVMFLPMGVESIQESGEMEPPVEHEDLMLLPMGVESIQEYGEMGPPVEPGDVMFLPMEGELDGGYKKTKRKKKTKKKSKVKKTRAKKMSKRSRKSKKKSKKR